MLSTHTAVCVVRSCCVSPCDSRAKEDTLLLVDFNFSIVERSVFEESERAGFSGVFFFCLKPFDLLYDGSNTNERDRERT